MKRVKVRYNKLVIISWNELDTRIVTLFGIRELVKTDINIEYWNVSSITINLHLKEINVEGISSFTIDSLPQFEKAISSNNDKLNTLYAVYMNYAPQTVDLYKILSSYNCRMLYCINGELPIDDRSKHWYLNILGRRGVAQVRKYADYIFHSYQLRKLLPDFLPLKYELHTCSKAVSSYKTNRKTKIVAFNSTDFETSKMDSQRFVEGDYIVFIDQFLPLHPDGLALNLPQMNAEKYFNSINKLFAAIEINYHCPVVIAAHPTSLEYYTKENPFCGRKILWGQTSALIKHCIGAISHFSTAITFPVVFQKPVLFISSDEIEKLREGCYSAMKQMAVRLDSIIVNMDHIQNKTVVFPQLNMDCYIKYKYDYLTNRESEGKSNAQIMSEILNGNYE